jgi:hypothetical protein
MMQHKRGSKCRRTIKEILAQRNWTLEELCKSRILLPKSLRMEARKMLSEETEHKPKENTDKVR